MDQVTKIYYGKVPYRALNNIHLTIKQGEFVGIMYRLVVGRLHY